MGVNRGADGGVVNFVYGSGNHLAAAFTHSKHRSFTGRAATGIDAFLDLCLFFSRPPI